MPLKLISTLLSEIFLPNTVLKKHKALKTVAVRTTSKTSFLPLKQVYALERITKSEAIKDFDLPDGQIQQAYKNHAFEVVRNSLKNIKSTLNQDLAKVRKGGEKSLFAFGDLHGALDLFARELYVAGLISENGHWLSREERITRYGNTGKVALVHTGDFFDRGFYSWELYEYLKVLHEEAVANGDKFEIILGNHELSCLEDAIYGREVREKYGFFNFFTDKDEKLRIIRKELHQDILANKIKLAALVNGRVYTHAGIIKKYVTKAELADPNLLVKRLNKLLRSFAANGRTNPEVNLLFETSSPLRNRNVRDLAAFKQVYGHTVPHDEAFIRVLNNGLHYNIDTGQSPYFTNGRLCFLNIIDDKPSMVFSNETTERDFAIFDHKSGLPIGNILKSYELGPLNLDSWEAKRL